MAKESVYFPETRIGDVVRVIRAGIEALPDLDEEVVEGLEDQCVDLLQYKARLEAE